MRSDLLLPDDCPYLNAIQKDLRDATAKKREREDNEELYDLTKKCYGRIWRATISTYPCATQRALL